MTPRIAVIVLFFCVLAISAWGGQNGYAPQVVEVNVTHQQFDPVKPWTKINPGARQTTAVVVEGPFLLTSAQMVEDATFVEVKKFGGPVKVPARVVHVDPEINLALLTVDAEGFYDDLKPVKLATAAPVGGVVNSVRWKNGQLEVSTSRVARLEVRQSYLSDLEHLMVRVKSDLGGGGWAEPVFKEDLLAGLTASQDEDLADVIPPELIAAYLREVNNPRGYRGFGNIGFSWQKNEDKALAGYLGLKGEPRGIIILNVPWGATGCSVLKSHDILFALGGHDLDSAGYYQHPVYGRLRFQHIAVDGHWAGDILKAKVLRDGALIDLDVPLRRFMTKDRLIPWRQYNQEPGYFVGGGFVFRELTGEYFSSWGDGWQQKADLRLVTFWNQEKNAQTKERRRIVILAYVLPSAYNIGYHELVNLAVDKINGKTVHAMSEVEEGFANAQGNFHRITLFPNRIRNEIILDATTYEDESRKILSLYNIPAEKRLPPSPADLSAADCGADPPPISVE